MKVRSEPILASTEDSDRLNRTAVIVSVEVGNVRFETAALLVGRQHGETGRVADCTYFVSSHICTIFDAVANTGSER